eukprot:2625799-Prymnesium_polylepis.1
MCAGSGHMSWMPSQRATSSRSDARRASVEVSCGRSSCSTSMPCLPNAHRAAWPAPRGQQTRGQQTRGQQTRGQQTRGQHTRGQQLVRARTSCCPR